MGRKVEFLSFYQQLSLSMQKLKPGVEYTEQRLNNILEIRAGTLKTIQNAIKPTINGKKYFLIKNENGTYSLSPETENTPTSNEPSPESQTNQQPEKINEDVIWDIDLLKQLFTDNEVIYDYACIERYKERINKKFVNSPKAQKRSAKALNDLFQMGLLVVNPDDNPNKKSPFVVYRFAS